MDTAQATGEKVWGPTTAFTNPLAYYDQTSAVCAYGKLYTWTFGGEVYLLRHDNRREDLELEHGRHGPNTPYGVNPLWIIGNYEASVADGMILR